MSEQKIKVLIEAEAKRVKQEVEELQGSVKNLYSSIALMVTKITEIANTIDKVTDYTDEYISSMRLLGTVFDENLDKASGFAETM